MPMPFLFRVSTIACRLHCWISLYFVFLEYALLIFLATALCCCFCSWWRCCWGCCGWVCGLSGCSCSVSCWGCCCKIISYDLLLPMRMVIPMCSLVNKIWQVINYFLHRHTSKHSQFSNSLKHKNEQDSSSEIHDHMSGRLQMVG